MIKYIEGNLFDSQAQALVNTVNTVGVMGKGVALQFKNYFPNNFRRYVEACKDNTIHIGKLLVVEEESLHLGRKLIINFPTKTDWKKPSEYIFIEKGVSDLIRIIEANKIKSIAIPPLGAGNGGLNWTNIKEILESQLSGIDCDIYIYQPNYEVKEAMRKERVKLTPARSMLLSIMYELVRDGEFVSEFAAEKIAYFLQRFGAKNAFNLDFKPNYYGPYSGKVKHVLYYMNGSYISGYSSKDRKPFEELDIIPDAEADVIAYLRKDENKENLEIVEKTKHFLKGFYSSFSLELLSTIDFIMNEKKVSSVDEIRDYLEKWSNRKKTHFSNPNFINIAVNRIESYLKAKASE